MIKLCWMKDFYGNTDEYYYDKEENLIYCINLADYNKKVLNFSPVLAALVVGPVVTFIEIALGNKHIVMNLIFLAIILIFLLAGGIFINLSYEKSEEKKAAYIRSHAVGSNCSKEGILQLLNTGKKYRAGLCFFVLICAFLVLFSILIYITDGSASSVVMFYIGFYSEIIWLKMMAPIKIYTLKKFLSK